MQEEMGLIAMRVFEKPLARESAEGTIDSSSQIEGGYVASLSVGLSET